MPAYSVPSLYQPLGGSTFAEEKSISYAAWCSVSLWKVAMTRKALISLASALRLLPFHSLSLYTLHLLLISPDASLLLQSENRS